MTDLDLVEHLAEVAAEAVRKRRGAIKAGGLRNLNGIMIELELANNATAIKVDTHSSRRAG